MSLIGRAFRVYREQGSREFARRIRIRFGMVPPLARQLVRFEDAQAVDWRTPHPAVAAPTDRGSGPWTVAWIMSPPGANSGGHQNIFRFIRFLQAAGHRCVVYLYSNTQVVSPAETKALVASSSAYAGTPVEVRAWTGDVSDDVDAIVATGWETAYPSFRAASMARRFYFVQDFEPWFTAAGAESALAEATYRFGFRGITAGRWLEGKLRDEYGMVTDHFDFGADPEHYRLIPGARRDQVFFYARPATERRGYELGIMALDLVAKARPGVTINLVGEDLGHFEIPFRHRNLHGVGIDELGGIYNRCAVGLVLSFSNLSLLPLELLGAGTIPVVNDAPNNRLVVDNPYIVYATPTPAALAEAILAELDAPDREARAVTASASVETADWAVSGEQFLGAFERGMA